MHDKDARALDGQVGICENAKRKGAKQNLRMQELGKCSSLLCALAVRKDGRRQRGMRRRRMEGRKEGTAGRSTCKTRTQHHKMVGTKTTVGQKMTVGQPRRPTVKKDGLSKNDRRSKNGRRSQEIPSDQKMLPSSPSTCKALTVSVPSSCTLTGQSRLASGPDSRSTLGG